MAGLAASRAGQASTKPDDRPNILWLVSEDNNPYIGAYGDRLANTPTIDGLAARGVLFRKVYSNAPVCAPSRFGILTGVYPESCAPANQMRALGTFPKEFRTYPELMRGAGYFCTNNAKTDYNCDVSPKAIWDVQGAAAHWRATPRGKPFMAVFNYETTHESQIFKPTAGRITPTMVNVPPYLPDTLGIRQDVASYYNLIEKMDGQLASRIAELEADGLADDTIIFHYSDNGGVLGRSKRYCYEEGLRCEMIVYAPSKWQHLLPAAPGEEVTNPVSFIDLAPTLLSLAGVAQPPQMRGRALLGRNKVAPGRYAFGMRNRMDERIDFVRTVTDGRWRYIRNYMPHRPWGQHQAFAWLAKGYQDWETEHRAGRLRPDQDRFFHPKPFEEIYDLESDPYEVENRIGDAASERKLTELRRALDDHMIAIHDNGFIPETMAGEGFLASRAAGAYPLKRIMAVAKAAASRNPNDLPKLLAALESSNDILRYWGATGLLILGAAAEQAAPALRARLREDRSPLVRIVVAEALTGLGKNPEAVAYLAARAGDPASWQVQLHALNALTFIGDKAMDALPEIRKAAESEQEYIRSAGRYLAAVLEGRYSPSLPIFELDRLLATSRKSG